jgi:hypothetical protein
MSLLAVRDRAADIDDSRFPVFGSAGALLLIDIVYLARGVIAPIYLADAGAELVLIAYWLVTITESEHGVTVPETP